jgi:hypothetical protein
MCCFDEHRWNDWPQSRREESMRAHGDWIGDVASQGKYVGGGKLADTTAAACVTARNGKTAITDGPFAETKEQLGGYHIVDCADPDGALALAARIPTLPTGGKIEVRAMQHLIPGTHTHPSPNPGL